MTYPDQRRNLNPTPEARLAMSLWGVEYSRQNGGCMDFWDGLADGQKRTVRDILAGVADAAIAHRVTLESMSRGGSHA